VLYGFFEANQCPVGTLDVLIRTTGEGEIPGTTPQPQPEEVCVRIGTFCLPARQISLLTLFAGNQPTPFSTQMTINNQNYTTEFRYCASPGSRFTVCAPRISYAEDQSQRIFQYWASYDDTNQEWEPFSESTCVGVRIEEGGWIAAFYECATTSGSTTPEPQPEQECLRISAFYMPPQEVPTTTAFKPGTVQFLAGPLPFQIQMVVNRTKRYTTEFTLCGSGRAMICAPEEAFTHDQQQLVFSYWAIYHEPSDTWKPFSESACIQQTVGNEWLAAFYQVVVPQTELY